MMTARYALTGDESLPSAIASAIGENARNPTREALWGSPGTAIAALLIRECNGDARFDDVLRSTHDELWETWEAPRGDDGSLWVQDLYGQTRRFVGAGHGAPGNLVPFVGALDLLDDGRRAALRERIVTFLDAYAIDDGDACNWCRSANRAPAIACSGATAPRNDHRARAASGAPARSPRARRSVMERPETASRFYDWRNEPAHAIDHVERWRVAFGMPSASLWTGDMGVALFVDAVLRQDPAIPSMDAL